MKIIAIGRNYVEHIAELNNERPHEPVIFTKPDTALVRNNQPFYIPDFSTDIHYEAELVLRISKLGKNIHERFARRYYDAIGLGIDFTARDLQNKAKEKGLPWALAKGFDLHQSVKFSTAVASLSCREYGGRKGVPDWEQALAVAETLKKRALHRFSLASALKCG